MARAYIVGFNVLSNQGGELVTDTPVIPLRIFAETAAAALEVFAERTEGTIIHAAHSTTVDAVDAKVVVDQRIFRVRVCDGTLP
ncbi:MAG TPA: hypothetical protein VLV78_01300 [Thermoanaerobaculia bacterium]|nr:hypothetical protein [Thermoanaerobaculia bacterium]